MDIRNMDVHEVWKLFTAVYFETMNICRAGEYKTRSGKIVKLPRKEDVLGASKFYEEVPWCEAPKKLLKEKIDVVNVDCIEAARELAEKGLNPILLNMANRHMPGGGALNGARAQEESLFRQSNLCLSLYQYRTDTAELMDLPAAKEQYPMDRFWGGIYSGRVTFFRGGSSELFELCEKPFECAVVSVAAINGPELDRNGKYTESSREITLSKIRSILRIARLHGHETLVLGAFGCGAFCNPPEQMAALFDEVLHEDEFWGAFKLVRFAIINNHRSSNNFESFEKVLNGKKE